MDTRRQFLRNSALALGSSPLLMSTGASAAALGTARPAHLRPRSVDPRWHRLEDAVNHRFVRSSDGVRLHYVVAGSGPLVVFVHGFPGWWWTWRMQMSALMDNYTVAALDMRGYGDSGQPRGSAAYHATQLMNDIAAVIRHTGNDHATVVGHDFGGASIWPLAGFQANLVPRLAVLNAPHPAAMFNVLRSSAAQRKAFSYSQLARRVDASTRPLPRQLSEKLGNYYSHWSADVLALVLSANELPEFKTHKKAMKRSSIRSALAYYRANIPPTPYPKPDPLIANLRIPVPTLMVWGMKDEFLLPPLLDASLKYIDGPLEVARIENADHFVHNQQPELVSATLLDWLQRTDSLLA